SLSRGQPGRFLVALAHDSITMDTRLCFLSSKCRLAASEISSLCEPRACHGGGRALAWRGLGFRSVGPHAWSLSGLIPSVRILERRGGGSAVCIAKRSATYHSVRSRGGVGTVPSGLAGTGDDHAQVDVRKFLVWVFVVCEFLSNGTHMVWLDCA